MMEKQTKMEEDNLRELIIYLVNVVRRRLVVLFTVFLLIVGLGVYRQLTSEEAYVSNTIILNSKLIKSKKDMQFEGAGLGLLNSIAILANDGDIEKIAEKLKLDFEDIKSLKEIEVESVKESLGSYKIELYFSTMVDAEKIMTAVMEFLNSNDFIYSNTNLVNEKDQNMLEEIQKEIDLLNQTVEHIINSDDSKKAGLAYIYPRLSELYVDKSSLAYRVKLNKPYYLLAKNESIQVKQSLVLGVLKYSAYSIFISIILIVGIELVVFVKEYLRNE